jgi:hypothetical protein
LTLKQHIMSELLTQISDEMPLWRYLSFSKLTSLFSQGALYFSRADGFLDPFEGALGASEKREELFGVWDAASIAADSALEPPPSGSHRHTLTIDDKVWALMLKSVGNDVKRANLLVAEFVARGMRTNLSDSFRSEYRSTFICCWHNSEHESEAMWRLYSKDTAEGVAFRTTAGLLRNARIDQSELAIRHVEYRDDYLFSYDDDPLKRFLTKRVAFEHEKEIRTIVTNQEAGGRNEPGHYVTVDVGKLIQVIVISPYAPSWMLNTLTEVARKFGVPAPVEISRLGGSAFHY